MDSSWERHIIADPMHGGMPVAAFYHPPGWQAGSQVMWNPAEKQSPVRIIAHAGPPDGSLTLEFLPSQAYAWPPMPLTMPGQNADGVIMMQPMPAADAVVRMIVPAFRARCDNLQVISAEQVNMPAPSDPRIPPGAAQVFKARVRIRYSFKGVEREEEFRAEQTIIHGGMTFWQLHNVASFSAPAGALDANLSIFDHVEQSWFENEQWKTLLQQVVSQGLAAANAQINAQIEAGRMQTERFIQESNARMQRNADYVARQGARIAAMEGGPYLGTTKTFSASDMLGGDRGGRSSDYTAHDQRIDSIYERQTVDNPANSANNKISADADHVWRNHNGDLLGSNDPNFDPNTGTEFGNWTRATIKRPGG